MSTGDSLDFVTGTRGGPDLHGRILAQLNPEERAIVAPWLERPDSFAPLDHDWQDRLDSGLWSWPIGVASRDSGALQRANARAILAALAKSGPEYDEATHTGDWQLVKSSHWAVGYVDELTIRLLDDAGELTGALRTLLDLHRALEDYPVLDDDLLADEEHQDRLDTIEFGYWPDAASLTRRDAELVVQWLWDHDREWLDGDVIADEDVHDALKALGYQPDEDEDLGPEYEKENDHE